MSVSKTAVALLVVGLVVGIGIGYGIGFIFYQQEISGLNTDLSTAQAEIDSLKTQVSTLTSERSDLEAQISSLTSEVSGLTSEVSVLQSDLEDALGKAATMETKFSAIEEACVQLEKDRVFLETHHKTLTTVAETLEEVLPLWSDVRESSGDVDPALPSKIDAIMSDVKAIFDWMDRGKFLMVEDIWEVLALWQQEGMTLMLQYQADYYAFESAYSSAIQRHIKATTELTES